MAEREKEREIPGWEQRKGRKGLLNHGCENLGEEPNFQGPSK